MKAQVQAQAHMLPPPVGVWDAAHPNWLRLRAMGAYDWVQEHIGDGMRITRIEFYLIDAPLAVVTKLSKAEYVWSSVQVPLRNFPPDNMLAVRCEN